MNKTKFGLILALLVFFQPIYSVTGTKTIVDSTLTLDTFDMKWFSFSVGFAQTAEITINFQSTGDGISVYLLNKENFDRFAALNLNVQGWSIDDQSSGSMTHELSSGKWYIVLWNIDLLNSKTVSITATLDIIVDNSLFFLLIIAVTIGGGVFLIFIVIKNKKSIEDAASPVPVGRISSFCSECGTPNEKKLQFCGNCGVDLILK